MFFSVFFTCYMSPSVECMLNGSNQQISPWHDIPTARGLTPVSKMWITEQLLSILRSSRSSSTKGYRPWFLWIPFWIPFWIPWKYLSCYFWEKMGVNLRQPRENIEFWCFKHGSAYAAHMALPQLGSWVWFRRDWQLSLVPSPGKPSNGMVILRP